MNATNAHCCRVCSSPDLLQMFEVSACALERCQRCQFVQVAEQPSQETLEALYSGSYFDKGKYGDDDNQRRENDRRMRLLRSLGIPSKSRILDAGCATGDFLKAAKDHDMWGVDISEEAVAEAKLANPSIAEQISSVPLEELPFPDDHFDAVVLWDVIEHLWSPRQTCQDLLRLVRPGGYLVLSTPDIGALTARLMGRRWAFMTPPEHLGFFNVTSFQWLLEKELGTEIVRSYAAGKWVNAGFLSYKLQRVFPDIVPKRLVSMIQDGPFGQMPLYVPSQDIRYIAARKPRT